MIIVLYVLSPAVSYGFFKCIIIIHSDNKIDIIAEEFKYIAPIMKSWNTSYLSSRKNPIILVLVVFTDKLIIIEYSYTLFNVSCHLISFSANIIVSSAYSNTNNFNNTISNRINFESKQLSF